MPVNVMLFWTSKAGGRKKFLTQKSLFKLNANQQHFSKRKLQKLQGRSTMNRLARGTTWSVKVGNHNMVSFLLWQTVMHSLNVWISMKIYQRIHSRTQHLDKRVDKKLELDQDSCQVSVQVEVTYDKMIETLHERSIFRSKSQVKSNHFTNFSEHHR